MFIRVDCPGHDDDHTVMLKSKSFANEGLKHVAFWQGGGDTNQHVYERNSHMLEHLSCPGSSAFLFAKQIGCWRG